MDPRNPAPRPPPPMAERPRPPQNSSAGKRSIPRPNISPALYAIPESTPLPDSSSSFPPASPYIINHKRRGPRLLKSSSRNDCSGSRPPSLPQVEQRAEAVTGNGVIAAADGSHNSELDGEWMPGPSDGVQDSIMVGLHDGKLQDSHVDINLVGSDELAKSCSVDLERDVENEDFFDPQDSLSTASNSEVDRSNGSMRSKPGTPSGEYFDAFEEVSSDDTSRSSCGNTEDELREMRLNFLMEIERCKQAEEAVENLQNQWQMLSHHLSFVGLKLPAPPTFGVEVDEEPNIDPAEELCQQIVVSRLVADTIGRASSSAEVEMAMEPLIESKNFEIARLQDRLQYYEAANREMSQRNQEAVELARQRRNKCKRRQKWIWCSIGLLATLGATAITWSYLPVSRSSTCEGEATESHDK